MLAAVDFGRPSSIDNVDAAYSNISFARGAAVGMLGASRPEVFLYGLNG
jgi:hypothetical protein